MFEARNIIKTAAGHSLKAGSYIGGPHANPLSRFKTFSKSLLWEDGKLKEVEIVAKATLAKEIFFEFGAIKPIPFAELARSLRKSALEKVAQLAALIRLAGRDALPLVDGVIPLCCVYFTQNGVLVLSKELCEVARSTLGDRESDEQSFALSWPRFADKLAVELVQFLYFALMGFFPFADEKVRSAGAGSFLPLASATEGGKGNRLCHAIDQALLPSKNKLEIDEFLQSLPWDLEADVKTDFRSFDEARTRLGKKASRARFWRRKGPMLAAALAILGVLAWLAGNFLFKEFGPPPSAGLGAKQLVERYYRAQSELDLEQMTDSLAFGVRSPAESEVAALHVARAARIGYEHFDCLASPAMWEASGRGPLEEGKLVYGVENLKISTLGPNTIRAVSLLYKCGKPEPDGGDAARAAADDGRQEDEGFVSVLIFAQIEDFEFEKHKNWLRISKITTVETKLQERVEVPTFEGRRKPLS